ncbi:hypothetical protein OPU71_21095 [Niveibacterium sp. 24ML]|uniref:hypothetical protein n=1 Tax=Niveibacterium sp. 24ML TaxID=2985512 RepID=UPI00226FAEAA|nr:hypothetical protein [Niveibacterium sp. 24ML]MCX9158618.1 hypothetical protein [Niveibacterium sp. 24ML]
MALHSQLDDLIGAMLPFVQEFHARSQLAPHAASINVAGEIKGSALVTQDNQQISVAEAISHFETKFRESAASNEIVASAIFFHGVGLSDPARPAENIEDACVIVALLEHKAGDSVYLVVPYERAGDGFAYQMGKLVSKPCAVFSTESKTTRPWWRIW